MQRHMIPGFIINGYNLKNIWYADDTVPIVHTERKLQELKKESMKKGLNIN